MATLRITNGHALRPDHTVEKADVLIDQDAGTILEVGDINEGDTVIDAGDGIVMPGLINAHTHVAMTLMRGFVEDLPLEQWLNETVWPVEAALEPADVRAGARLGIAEMIRSGITAFSDMYFEVPETADIVEQAGLRATLGHTAISVGKDPAAAHADMQQSLETARQVERATDGRIRATVQPHNPATVDHDVLEKHIPTAREEGIPLHYHTNETEEEVNRVVEETGMRPVRYADELGMLKPGDTLAHCVHINDEEIELLAKRGATVIHNPAANMKVASGIAPVPKLRDAGVPVALGTDGPASNNDLDMFDEMCDAAMVAKINTCDAAALPAESVIEMATVEGARALGIDSGRIEPGANADVIVVDTSEPKFDPGHNPVTSLVYTANGADVRHTVCDGQLLMHDRTLLTVDLERAKTEANRQAQQLFERAGVTDLAS
jgi:5-methylthioadenosine/S-adenosylhomocysteine deaminase